MPVVKIQDKVKITYYSDDDLKDSVWKSISEKNVLRNLRKLGYNIVKIMDLKPIKG